MKTVAPQDFHRLNDIDATQVLEHIAFVYGHKLANEIAIDLLKTDSKHDYKPMSIWPNF